MIRSLIFGNKTCYVGGLHRHDAVADAYQISFLIGDIVNCSGRNGNLRKPFKQFSQPFFLACLAVLLHGILQRINMFLENIVALPGLISLFTFRLHLAAHEAADEDNVCNENQQRQRVAHDFGTGTCAGRIQVQHDAHYVYHRDAYHQHHDLPVAESEVVTSTTGG